MRLLAHLLMKLFVLIVQSSVSYLFEMTIPSADQAQALDLSQLICLTSEDFKCLENIRAVVERLAIEQNQTRQMILSHSLAHLRSAQGTLLQSTVRATEGL